jgi:hypothetical protein
LQSDSQVADGDGCDVVIVTAGRRLDRQLKGYLGMVADLDLQGGGRVSGVLGAVSEHTVIIEEWDSISHEPNGKPLTIDITKIARVTIP